MSNFSKRKLLAAVLLVTGSTWAVHVTAQTRTFVSGVGNDADPCSRTAPCRTFAGAFNKTSAGGEINCLDPGGYGGLTINKSISIICQYTEGGSLVAGAGVNGITVNAGATDSVFLRGIDFHGATTATNGLRVLAGGVVHLQDSVIRRFNATNGLGVRITPSTATQVTITDTTIADNGTGATGGGILIQPTGAGGSAHVTLRNVRVQNNAANQLRVDTTGNTGAGISLVIEDSQFIGGTNGIQIAQPAATTSVIGMITGSTIALCSGTGIDVNGGSSTTVRVAHTTITRCGTGVDVGGGTINTYGNNRNDGNGAPGAFTLPAIAED
jgi:hypothetical protein